MQGGCVGSGGIGEGERAEGDRAGVRDSFRAGVFVGGVQGQVGEAEEAGCGVAGRVDLGDLVGRMMLAEEYKRQKGGRDCEG